MKYLKTLLHRILQLTAAYVLLAIGTVYAATTITPGVLVVGSDLTYPPYDYMEGNKPAGLDAEFVNELAVHMKVTYRFQDTRFANLILGLVGSRYDIIASALYVTPERAKTLDFIPYFMTGGSLMVNASSGFKPTSVQELCGKKVGSLKGAAWVPMLREVSDKSCAASGRGPITVQEYDTSSESAQALLSNAVEAQYDDAGVAKMIVAKLNGRIAITNTAPLNAVVCGLAVKKGNDELKSAVLKAFGEMKSSGQYQALLKKYNLVEPNQEEVARALGTSK
jgi:polar amino acid transport system substrate-binding protein